MYKFKQILPGIPVALFLMFVFSSPAFLSAQDSPQSAPERILPMPTIEISDAELSIFAASLLKIRDLGLTAQENIADRVDGSELSNERFIEIYESDQTLGAGEQTVVTDAERKEFDLIMQDIEVLQVEYEEDVGGILTDSGMPPERFDEIYLAAQNDFDLQERLRPLLEPAVAGENLTP